MYCGWQTRGARLRWAAVVFLLVAFVALGIMYAVVSKDCKICDDAAEYRDADTGETWLTFELCYDYKGSKAADLTKVKHCNKDFVVGSFMGFILSAILILVPCVSMCCATSPSTMAANQRAMAARAASSQGKAPQRQAPPPPTAPVAAPRAAPAPQKPGQKPRMAWPGKASKAKAPAAAADPLARPAF